MTKKCFRLKSLLFYILILSTFLLASCTSSTETKENINSTEINNEVDENTNPDLQAAEFIRAVDGDTIKVNIDGEEFTVRMIGIDTPESVHPDKEKNNEFGEMASKFTKSMFSENQTIYLEKDVSDTDKYGRLLRYVWLSPSDNLNDGTEIEEKMYNAVCVKEGFAKSVRYGKDTKHADTFDKLEKNAYENQKGLWGITDSTFSQEIKEEPSESSYIGNSNSKKFHKITCGGLPSEKNRVYFSSREEAIENGFSPCKTCNP